MIRKCHPSKNTGSARQTDLKVSAHQHEKEEGKLIMEGLSGDNIKLKNQACFW
jgi:hypothetical protein